MMRKVGLGFPPFTTVVGEARLPLVQRISGAIASQTKQAAMSNDALRIGNPRACRGYLASPQIFTRPLLESGVNSPASMATGLMIRNAPRTVDTTRGQAAGI
jgi:hypothetical protein